MQSSLRSSLLLTALCLISFGCDNATAEQSKPMPCAAGSGGTDASCATGGTGGDTNPSTGGMGVGGSAAGTGGDATAAGTGGGAGTAAAGVGGSSAGATALGGMGGDATAAGGMSGTAGMSGGGAGGMGPVDCATLDPNAKSFAGHCYLLVTNAVNFDGAKNDCMSKQAHLVTISNGDPASQDTFDAEDAFVYQLAGGKDTWIGLADGKKDRDPGDGTFYKWVTGEPSPLDAWGQAYGWVSGEPNNYQKKCSNGDTCYEHCGFMVSDQGDKWNDDLCESTKQYVCEWDMSVPATL